MLFTHSLMGWEAPGKMGVSSSAGHAWLRQCGFAAVAQGALLSGCVWEYQEWGLGRAERVVTVLSYCISWLNCPSGNGGILWWVPQAPKVTLVQVPASFLLGEPPRAQSILSLAPDGLRVLSTLGPNRSGFETSHGF